MGEYTFLSTDTKDTILFAKKLANLLQPKDVIALEGDLGAGKTTFTKGLAEGLGIDKNINSPTFTIIKEYEGKIPLYHMDVYRLEDTEEDLGFDEYFYGDGVTVVEWAHFIEDQLPVERLTIELKLGDGNERIIQLIPSGDRYEHVCKELFS